MHVLIIKLNLKLPPEVVYYNLSDSNYFCFLDSSLKKNKYSKFSYIAFDPFFAIKSKERINVFLDFSNGKTIKEEKDPIEFLEENISKNINFSFNIKRNEKREINYFFFDNITEKFIEKSKTIEKLLPDFKGGFIGYFSYDLKNYIENLPKTCIDDLDIPDLCLAYFKNVFAFSHKENCWYYVSSYDENEDFYNYLNDKKLNEEIFSNFAKKVESELIKKIKIKTNNEITKNIIDKYINVKISKVKIFPSIAKKTYLSKLKKAKEYIHNGDIYQMNFTHRFYSKLPIKIKDFYYILRNINSAPFCAYLNFPEVKIASTSPERFLYIKKDKIQTRPIKGTMPRGINKKEEKFFKEKLINSIKDKAELNMIVDLERNDLGRFCKYGSVKVKEHAIIEKYAKVFHLVSTVIGKIRKNTTFSEILKSTFPGGSITGAPKIRAMQIIDELEKYERSVYTGSIGYISVDGIVDLNIAIRTFIIKNNYFYYNAGGGIVEDSVPEQEYAETLQKGLALKQALKFFQYNNLIKLRR